MKTMATPYSLYQSVMALKNRISNVEQRPSATSLQPQLDRQYAKTLPRYTPPSGLGWPSRFAFESIELPNGEFTALLDPKSLVTQSIWSGPAFYVSTTGSDSADGSLATPLRSIWKATELGDATGVPYRVMIKGGQYRMPHSINGQPPSWPTPPVAALKEPVQPCALIAYDGRVEIAAMRDVTFPSVKDGTQTNCFAITNCEGSRRVFDRTRRDSYGNFFELTNAASLAACNATTDTWFQSGSTLYINWGSTVPSYTNLLATANTYVAAFLANTADVYLEGINFFGGSNSAVLFDPIATRNIVGVDCEFSYAGSSASGISGFRSRRTAGLTALFHCRANDNSTDGFNVHADSVTGVYFLTIGCRALANGVSPNTSCNGWTTHDDVVGIDIGGDYGPQINGSTVHSIESAKVWCLGTRAQRTSVSGASSSAAFKISNSGIMWLEHCQAYAESGSVPALFSQASAAQLFNLSTKVFSGVVTVDSGTSYTVGTSMHNTIYPVNIPYAVTDPTTTDDATKGYRMGSRWVNLTDGGLHHMASDVPGAAVWRE